jgi:phosphoribosyl-ATP pyrophosphohydrolase
MTDVHVLDQLFATVEKRRQEFETEKGDATSRTQRLFKAGVSKISQKVGEEAVETIIEAMRGDKELLIDESADLLFHLNVLWSVSGVNAQEVWDELDRRQTLSETEERASRKS